MSMPLPAERGVPSHSEEWVPRSPELVIGRASIAPLTIEGYLWACRSLLSVWVPSHSEEWVLRSPELVIGRASITPLIRGSSLSMPLPAERLSFPLILRNEFSAPPSSVISLAGRASIAPLTIEGYLWACRSLLSGEFPLILRNEFPALQSSWLGLPLPSERRSASHSEEWVLHSPELVIGLTLRSEFSALELLIGSWVPLIPRNEFSALQGSPSVELALLPSTGGSPMSMPLPSERLSSLSLRGMSSSPLQGIERSSISAHARLWALSKIHSVVSPHIKILRSF